MEAYLDNAATTKVSKEVIDAMTHAMSVDYGNPSSKHLKGVDAENEIKEAKKQIAKTLKCQEGEILFTSGGTESNNMALVGTALAKKREGKHIITTSIEHPAVYEPLFFLEENGFEVTYLPVDPFGRVNREELVVALRPDTILVSIMYVNNEIGAVNDIPELSKAVKEYNDKIVFHVDAIQAYGKFPIFPSRIGIDLMSVSGHKLHGPKGIGFLYIKDKVRVHPIIFGGGQQKGMRSGTENVPGIVGLGVAAKEVFQKAKNEYDSLWERKRYLAEGLTNRLEGVTLNGYVEGSAPHIVSASFDDIRSEVLLHALEDKGIFVSSGSACSSNHPGISGTLKAIHVQKELLDATIRFSLSFDTTIEEIDYTIDALEEILPILRKYQRR